MHLSHLCLSRQLGDTGLQGIVERVCHVVHVSECKLASTLEGTHVFYPYSVSAHVFLIPCGGIGAVS